MSAIKMRFVGVDEVGRDVYHAIDADGWRTAYKMVGGQPFTISDNGTPVRPVAQWEIELGHIETHLQHMFEQGQRLVAEGHFYPLYCDFYQEDKEIIQKLKDAYDCWGTIISNTRPEIMWCYLKREAFRRGTYGSRCLFESFPDGEFTAEDFKINFSYIRRALTSRGMEA